MFFLLALEYMQNTMANLELRVLALEVQNKSLLEQNETYMAHMVAQDKRMDTVASLITSLII